MIIQYQPIIRTKETNRTMTDLRSIREMLTIAAAGCAHNGVERALAPAAANQNLKAES